MRFQSGVTDQYIYFVAVDSTDYVTRETGLSSFTVRRSRDGAASAAFTTPTINETDVTNMPGVYELLLDEDMTIASGNDSEAVALHITHAGMAPVTLTYELYRPTVTAGETLTVTSGLASANATQISGDSTAADNLEALLDGTLTGPYAAFGILESGTAQSATATTLVGRAAGAVADDAFNGCVLLALGSTQGYWQAAAITDTTLSSDTFTIVSWPSATPSGTITYVVIGVPNSSAVPLSVDIVSVNSSTTAADNMADFFTGTGYNAASSTVGVVSSVSALGANAINAAAIATGAVDADAIAADAVTEIQSGLATAAALTTIDDFLDTEIAAIKAKTDQLTFTVANQVDANTESMNATTILGTGTSGDLWRG